MGLMYDEKNKKWNVSEIYITYIRSLQDRLLREVGIR